MATAAPTKPALRGSDRPQASEAGGAVIVGQRRRNPVVVTGFGRFRGVDDNPTQRLIEALSAEGQAGASGDDVTPLICRVIEVSAAGAAEAVEALHCEAEAKAKAASSSGQEAGQEKEEHDDDAPVLVFLHMGVDAGATEFKLECRAFNEADFRCPDERAHQPRNAPILPEHSSDTAHAYYTHLDLASLVTELRSEGWPVSLSHDAGRFVCNYTYYQSLHRCRARPEADRCCLFLHVPPFASVDQPRQLAFVRRLLAALAAVRPHHGHADTLRALAPPPGTATYEDEDTVFVNSTGNAKPGDAAAVAATTTAPPSKPAAVDEAAVAGVMDLGFDRAQAEMALAAVAQRGGGGGGSSLTEAAINWLLETDGGTNVPAATTRSSAVATMAVEQGGFVRYKMVLVVRDDLGMSPGKIAAQCVHAALGVYQGLTMGGGARGTEMENGFVLVTNWQAQGEPVIALKCPDLNTLRSLEGMAQRMGLPTHVVRDAGRTQVEPGSVTVLAVGPAPAPLIDSVTGSLRLL